MDRRDFLRKSAIGTLGLTLSPALFNSCGTSASKGTSSMIATFFQTVGFEIETCLQFGEVLHPPPMYKYNSVSRMDRYGEASMPPYLKAKPRIGMSLSGNLT